MSLMKAKWNGAVIAEAPEDKVVILESNTYVSIITNTHVIIVKCMNSKLTANFGRSVF